MAPPFSNLQNNGNFNNKFNEQQNFNQNVKQNNNNNNNVNSSINSNNMNNSLPLKNPQINQVPNSQIPIPNFNPLGMQNTQTNFSGNPQIINPQNLQNPMENFANPNNSNVLSPPKPIKHGLFSRK